MEALGSGAGTRGNKEMGEQGERAGGQDGRTVNGI